MARSIQWLRPAPVPRLRHAPACDKGRKRHFFQERPTLVGCSKCRDRPSQMVPKKRPRTLPPGGSRLYLQFAAEHVSVLCLEESSAGSLPVAPAPEDGDGDAHCDCRHQVAHAEAHVLDSKRRHNERWLVCSSRRTPHAGKTTMEDCTPGRGRQSACS
jgi:hypothetical protein